MLQLIVFLVFATLNRALLVRQLGSNTTMKIEHRTAQFGPQPGQYNVSGELVLSATKHGCVSPNVSYTGKVVLILRNQCTFSAKVLHAQENNASGVIIGDDRTTIEWIQMVTNNLTAKYEIPAVFVQNSNYNFLAAHASPSTQPASSMHSRRSLATNEKWIVLMNAVGEYSAPTSPMNVWRFLGYLLLFIPTVWCLVTIVLVIVRGIRSCVNRRRRERQLLNIPIVEYLGVTDKSSEGLEEVGETVQPSIPVPAPVSDTSETKLLESSDSKTTEPSPAQPVTSRFSSLLSSLNVRRAPARLTPHNDTCAVCLEEFEIGRRISILPCRHGYHEHCINPWLRGQSELCPMCKQSIFISQDDNNSSQSDQSWFSFLKCCSHQRHARQRRVRDDGLNSGSQEPGQLVLVDDDSDVEEDVVADNPDDPSMQAAYVMPVTSNGYSELPNSSLTREQQIVLQSVRRMGL